MNEIRRGLVFLVEKQKAKRKKKMQHTQKCWLHSRATAWKVCYYSQQGDQNQMHQYEYDGAENGGGEME